jgi:hypothetical protein
MCHCDVALAPDGIFCGSGTALAQVSCGCSVPLEWTQRTSGKGRQGIVPIRVVGLAFGFCGEGESGALFL